MLYQLDLIPLLLVTVLDLFALFFLYRLRRVRQQFVRITAYLTALLFVGSTAFLKLLSTAPTPLASTPGDLHIINNTDHWFQTFYYVGENAAGQPYAYWREYMFGTRKVRVLEIEDTPSLLVAKKIDGEWRYQRIPTTSMVLKLNDARFHPDTSGRIAQAVHARQWRELGTYLSELLTLAILYLLVTCLPDLGKRPEETAAFVVPAT